VVYVSVTDGMAQIEDAKIPLGAIGGETLPGDLIRLVCKRAYQPPQRDNYIRFDHPLYSVWDDVHSVYGTGEAGWDVDDGASVFLWPGDNWSADVTRVRRAIEDICNSELGFFAIRRDGRIQFEDRYRRVRVSDPVAAFTSAELTSEADVEALRYYANAARVTVFPREQESAFVVLYELAAGSRIQLPDVGGTRVMRLIWSDPAQRAVQVAAWEVVQLEYITDWTIDRVKQVDLFSVQIRPGLRGGDLVMTRASLGKMKKRPSRFVGQAYLTSLQVRGRILASFQPVVSQAEDFDQVSLRGLQLLDLVMPLQTEASFAEHAANLLLLERVESQDFVTVEADSRVSEVMADAAAVLDVGDKVTLLDAATGLDGVYFVEGRHLVIEPDRCRGFFRLAPASRFNFIVFDVYLFDDGSRFAL
jgi:hypothetical protein